MTFPIFPFVPKESSAVPVEVHRLDSFDYVRTLPPHGHTFFELIVITNGKGIVMLNGKQHQGSKGQAFAISPRLPHDLSALGSAEGWAVLFTPDALVEHAEPSAGLSLAEEIPKGAAFDLFRPAQGMGPILLNSDALRIIDVLLEKLDVDLRYRSRGYEFAVQATLRLLLVEVGRADTGAIGDSNGADNFRERLLITRVFADIDAHYSTSPGLESAARRLGISAAHLTTRLRQITGRTYGEWVIERRMVEARHRLVSTNQSLSQIAEHLGYQSPESFIRRFRAYHAGTPARWRETARRRAANS